MNKIIVNVIVVSYILLILMSKMFVNYTDYMHKKYCETNYSLCCDIILHDI